LIECASGWEVSTAPVLGDQAYGDDGKLRARLDGGGIEYVLSVGPSAAVFAPETVFSVPERKGKTGRSRSRLRPDREPCSIGELVARVGPERFQTVAFRDGPEGDPVSSRFVFLRVRALKRWQSGATREPREEWLIAEWPEGEEQPTDYWLSNLPADTEPERLARLARLRWKIELDYRQLKGELGLDHYEGRSYLGWHHHTALVSAAHGFLTLERIHPLARRPA
jgi:SRSO17 transposase